MLSVDVKRLENENAALRETLKVMQKQFSEQQLKPKACEYCKFYIQHYVKVGGSYTKTHCGHCTHGRVKGKKPSDTCQYFELGAYDIKHII